MIDPLDVQTFEDALDDLILDYLDWDLASRDDIISALEIKLYAMTEGKGSHEPI